MGVDALRRPLFPINRELIDLCASLTSYEKELLVFRYLEEKTLIDISAYYQKSKGTVSPQLARAVGKYESWFKLNESKATQIVEEHQRNSGAVEPDDDLKGRQSALDELHAKNVLGEHKLHVNRKIEEEKVRDLEIQVRNDPRTFAGYAERLFPTQFRELADIVGKRMARRAIVKALEQFTPFDEWRLEREEGRFDNYAKKVIEYLVKGKKREQLLERIRTNVPKILVCPKCTEEYGEVQVEFHQNHLDQFMCPKCKGAWVWRCPVCDELKTGMEVKMKYDIAEDEIRCVVCGHHRPVYPLEEEGTLTARRSRIIEETRKEVVSTAEAVKYADSVVFPRKYL